MRNSRNRLLTVAVCIGASLLLCSLGQAVARPGQHRSPAVTRSRVTNGQQDSLVDYFPLSVGNFWKYQFGDTTTIIEVQQYEADFGTVEFTVIGVSPRADALTTWHLIRRRTYLKVWYDNGGAWRQATVQDSTGFDLNESMSGQHTLQTPEVDMHNLFSFPPKYADSTSFLRYDSVRASTSYTLSHWYLDSWDAWPTYGHYWTYEVGRDTGIIQARVHYAGPNDWQHASFTLLSFVHPSIAGPYLEHPRPVEMTSLVGIPKDTAIVLRNIGSIPLEIANIRSSDTTLSASPLSNPIDAYSTGSIALHLTSRAAGLTSASLIITSNALTSPDSIVVTSSNIFAASVSLGARSVYFGYMLLSRKHLDSMIVLENTGNHDLIINSIGSDHGWFSGEVDHDTVPPGKSVGCNIRFAPYFPNLPGIQNGYLIVRSNALTSPDSIQVSGATMGGILDFNTHNIDFGGVHVGGGKADTNLRIRAWGSSDVGYVGRTAPSDPSYLTLNAVPAGIFVNATVYDTIRFLPRVLGNSHAFVVYSSRSNYAFDYATVFDTVRLFGVGTGGYGEQSLPDQFFLNQNYPNPFNPRTTIQYGLPTQTIVTLSVYNTLGQEVAMLVRGTQDGGYKEVTFDGSGLASGLYFYRMTAGSFVAVKRFLLLR